MIFTSSGALAPSSSQTAVLRTTSTVELWLEKGDSAQNREKDVQNEAGNSMVARSQQKPRKSEGCRKQLHIRRTKSHRTENLSG